MVTVVGYWASETITPLLATPSPTFPARVLYIPALVLRGKGSFPVYLLVGQNVALCIRLYLFTLALEFLGEEVVEYGPDHHDGGQ